MFVLLCFCVYLAEEESVTLSRRDAPVVVLILAGLPLNTPLVKPQQGAFQADGIVVVVVATTASVGGGGGVLR